MLKSNVFITALISTVFSTLLIACGGNKSSKPTSEPTPANPNASTQIKSYSVNNTTINANINSGSFSFSWKTKSSNPYEVDVYVSKDAFLSDKTDVRILGKRCGSSNFYDCNESATFTCNFTTANKVNCKDSETTNGQSDISSILSSLPQSAYIILEVCNMAYTSCEVESQKVTFH